MKARSFSHAGITVSNFNRAVRFYWDVFGCPLVGVSDTPPDRIRSFFEVGSNTETPSCKIDPQKPTIGIPWNQVGLTHISFNVRGTARWYDYLVKKGVECVSKPERSPRGHTFFFAKDMDGNLIELMDLGYMHHVLGWLGPLGGFLFRRGRYKKYYEAPLR